MYIQHNHGRQKCLSRILWNGIMDLHTQALEGNPEEDLKDYAIIDSGCSESMTGDKDKLLILKKNMTLIEVARTMLADSLLPIQFWAEAVNTTCYDVLLTNTYTLDLWGKFDGKSRRRLFGWDSLLDARKLFEEEKRRIALEKGKGSANNTLTLSTANTPSQRTGNTSTGFFDVGHHSLPSSDLNLPHTSRMETFADDDHMRNLSI
ncbi:hypothetical protein Tco_0210466 [Tanacetum coccineum]